jgi:signal peptidase II
MITKRPYIDAGLCMALGVFLLDQLTKREILAVFEAHDSGQIVITSFFNLTMVWNRGVSFGLFSAHDMPYVLIALALGLVGILLVWLLRAPTKMLALALGAVIGGALGNVVDRARYGAVFDFLDVHVMGYHWPAFNIADSAIVIGVVVLCIDSMFMEPKRRNKESRS